ncbi:O-antigen ligase family protein [Patescibacteria group bacterium]|nr:O-antigen ligase family protein [Patescibacteria group bacterium]
MILVYGFTVIIVGVWLLKMISEKAFILKRTPLDIPLILFLGANILSAIFSIDLHTSIWGYYSRSNGGLLSTISYLLLYWAFVSNMDLAKVKITLKFGLVSGVLISLWAILEHFGVSPSCVILRGEFSDSCWIQDVQARVFATLGQPNWLAAYLAMLIFPALYFLLHASGKHKRIAYYMSLIIMYLAFTFTYSRGPTLGLLAGLAIFLVFYFKEKLIKLWIPIVISSFLIVNLLFGSALTNFRIIAKFAAPARPGITIPPPTGGSSGTQLENGGTESGQIRLIVWKGALDIFRHYPIFGSGLETFAYSYYQYRPVEHNLTSEWDFLYNKAHNEYLNYLSTTGTVGFATYMAVIITFVFWSIRKLLGKKMNEQSFLVVSLLASYISYLVYNFFLFSVVIIAVFFYLFPALVVVTTDSLRNFKWPKKLYPVSNVLNNLIYSRPQYTKIAKGFIIFLTVYLLYSIFQIWYADTLFARGERAEDNGNPGRAYNLLSGASQLNTGEPFYKSELGFTAAQAASALQESDATLSAQLKQEAILQTEEVLKSNPKNVSFLRTAVRTYFELSIIDKSYLKKTLQTLDSSINLSPTDPKLFYNKALILDSEGRIDEEIKTLQEAIKLKPNYLEALTLLKEATAEATK